MSEDSLVQISDLIIDHLAVGIFALSSDMRVLRWNQFMESHSGLKEQQILGRNLFDVFPELPKRWLEKRFRACSC